ncbi:hypothetical protein GCM10011363_21110 [Marivita lacus]|uniref:DUF4145 domain-containing protein n=1 Tax=Marivita lacus TaxID=1323742 RepID=A0ABQ1KLS1_9RHOB|nr:DUF4145 domain-containing protein [Marivita lacus]GGC04198.1 hypothetical protein GCM10011363_21110 [Marivita lacus]
MPSSEDIISAYCPKCGDMRRAFVHGKREIEWHDDHLPIHGSETGYLLECCGCQELYFRKDSFFSEAGHFSYNPITHQEEYDPAIEVTYFPSIKKRPKPAALSKMQIQDRILDSILDELYVSLDNNLNLLAAIGIRTAFDRATELMGIDPNLRFNEKLSKLQDEGFIGETEKDILSSLIDAGNAAAHRGWKPSNDDLHLMLDIFEPFLERNLLTRHAFKSLHGKVPKRSKKKSDAPKKQT